MFTKLNSVTALKTLIKLSAVALTSPATVAVASSLYPDSPITKVTVSLASLILVEGCLLLGWEMLDQQGKQATIAQRWLYAGLAWIAYFSLFAIALYHNEGIAGFAFRLTLGVVLIYTSAEAGLLAQIKIKNQADKDIYKDRRVRGYARKLNRRAAMADLNLAARIQQVDREAKEKLYTLQKARQTERFVQLIESEQVPDLPEPVEMAKSTIFSDTLDKANQKRKLSKQQAIDATLQILSDNPNAKPVDIAAQIGKSRQTVYDYFKELEAAGKLQRNGSGMRAVR
jgi:hypothetical protein